MTITTFYTKYNNLQVRGTIGPRMQMRPSFASLFFSFLHFPLSLFSLCLYSFSRVYPPSSLRIFLYTLTQAMLFP